MALTSGERAALWRKRQRENPEKHLEYKRKERERYKLKKERGLVKSAQEMSDRERRKMRKRWRTNQRNKREHDKDILKAVENTMSPPTSPDHEVEHDIRVPPVPDGRRILGRKRVRKDRAKCYREIFNLRIELNRERRLKNKYKQRYYRTIKRVDSINGRKRNTVTNDPNAMYKIIVDGIRQRYLKTRCQKERKMIRHLVFRENLLKKYGLRAYATKMTGMRLRARELKKNKNSKTRQIRLKLKETITLFFERDDNSRVKAGKKATVTRAGIKKQIRLLNESIKFLHQKFLYENDTRISYSMFCKLKPFWVTKASEKDRETCLCKLHENPKFKINKLFAEKVIISSNINNLIENITCSKESKQCMYRECDRCKMKQIETSNVTGKIVEWYLWSSKRVLRDKVNEKGENVQTAHTMTVKELQSGTLETLVNDLQTDIQRLCRHVYNINNQYSSMRQIRDNLNDDTVLIHIDFSENYCCKYSSEIQSTHFGASKRQISIHTGVAYTKYKTVSFATVSDCLKHGPAAIWAHLDPILNLLISTSPNPLRSVHFVSDGPTTQYRSRINFFLFSKKIYEYQFKRGTWNFWESGHGKGAPDGIGAVIKRKSDELVNTRQRDVMKASDIVTGLTETGTTIKCFEVCSQQIENIEQEIPKKISPVPNTMKIHQVITTESLKIKSRVLSCAGSEDCPFSCTCFNPTETCFDFENTDRAPVQQLGESLPITEPAQMVHSDDINDKKGNGISLKPVINIEEGLVGQYCMVLYIHDGMVYPGVIVSVDEDEVEVKTMSKIGRNRWFWPMRDDILWYSKESIITLLDEEPLPVTKRHHKINDEVWNLIEELI